MPKQVSRKELQQAMPTASPPKRTTTFGQKKGADPDTFAFSLEDSEGPFNPASPQTTPPQSQQQSSNSGKPRAAKKKRVKVIEPFAA
mmetsp:Transcript_7259/g.10197  ORF Transcript_7259/g.10197 Transcript_7259/m.10197 type:complete len:87 (-) Transcript_7259:70-330(-)